MSIEPHGGRLIGRVLAEGPRQEMLARAQELPRVPVSARILRDMENIATGVMSPLTGFMNHGDFKSVVDDMHLANGLVWTIPIVLSTDRDTAKDLREGSDVALVDPSGDVAAVLHLEDKFTTDKKHYALQVFRTTDDEHPGVRRVYEEDDVYLGGPIDLLKVQPDPFQHRDLAPAETRYLFREKGWKRVVAFQTRNPIHRAHEYVQKSALELVDGLLIHPLVGETKKDDVPADVRMTCYETLISEYFVRERTVLSVFPVTMRYAGPREAVFHALLRKNYGCTHFIVGRDHAGVGDYYGPFDAQKIFGEFQPAELGVTPLFFDFAFYCRKCQGMVSNKTCPHGDEERLMLSGRAVRAMLAEGNRPPPEFTRAEVADILMDHYSGKGQA